MAWGSSSTSPPPPRSALSKLLPLLIFLIILGAFAFVAYQVYLVTQQVSKSASDKMASKNVSFTKDGVKVGVKELKNENYVDKTQGFLVKAWNLSTWPAYQSRLGWNSPKDNGNGGKVESRKPYSRSSSNR
ncbi:uncharacterized protein EAE98_009557 [Botrytis deweyae]|uniref:Uncharacterized protein n=2 Tax=Botrytis TaxID=33196 RepID=A0A4Z1JZJ7_9HELO|nr:uncharacterized protein EAE98_009557 [Botrytis deweyae]KAF7918779.1 hypothetical protein EAE98_009557 [Botrytis deweyae]KAF7922182.1 hypothetical protein EAE99_007362 [Botrytis elliptica]TGO74377.1 hypothetical protein BELL_0287g00010 [Botrytis elliptica]